MAPNAELGPRKACDLHPVFSTQFLGALAVGRNSAEAAGARLLSWITIEVMDYAVRLIREDEGGYSVLVPGLPGCVSQGETREEALENVKEAIQLYLEVAQDIAEEGEAASVRVDLNVA